MFYNNNNTNNSIIIILLSSSSSSALYYYYSKDCLSLFHLHRSRKIEFEFEKMLAFYFKSAVVVHFCFDLNICCLLVLAVKLGKKTMIALNV